MLRRLNHRQRLRRMWHDFMRMARQEQTREDLMGEATALVERIELALRGCAAQVVIGFRRDGAASVYFGEDPAYHFNSAGELRRAFAGGLLVKAERGRLVSMTRVRTEQQVQLHSRELDGPETQAWLAELAARLANFGNAIDAGAFRVVAQIPLDANVLARTRQLLVDLGQGITIAGSPRVR